MKAINQKATKKLESILRYEGIEKVGDHAKIENNDTYTPLSIEAIWQWEDLFEEPYPEDLSPLCISLCHYGEVNGDAMRDPEVCLFRSSIEGEMKYYPYYFRNDYVGAERKYQCPTPRTEARLQADLCAFMSQWIDNIIEQQYHGETPKGTRTEEEETNKKVAEINAKQKAALEANREEIIDPLETIEGQAKAEEILQKAEQKVRDIRTGRAIAKAAKETREARKERIAKAREEREATEKASAKRRGALVSEPPTTFPNARGIEKTEKARHSAHIAAQKKYERAQQQEIYNPQPKKNKGVIFTNSPAWISA